MTVLNYVVWLNLKGLNKLEGPIGLFHGSAGGYMSQEGNVHKKRVLSSIGKILIVCKVMLANTEKVMYRKGLKHIKCVFF